MDKNLIGKWNLTGTHSETGEMKIIDDEAKYRSSYFKWLQSDDLSKLSEIEETSGLQLSINEDKTFTEEKTGNPEIEWFDFEGVLDNEMTPFDGELFSLGKRSFLHLGKNKSSINQTNSPQIRYSDGDTIICDNIQIIDGDLIRIVSVLTDELYTNRTILRYEKASV